jgi:autotransporter-associated beta strand protein
MKPRNSRLFRSIDFRTTPCSRIVVTCLAVSAIALSSSASAAEFIWADSAGNTAFFNGASWLDGVAPANSTTTDTAVFTSVANAQPVLSVQSRSAGIDFQMAAGGLSLTGANQLFQIGATGINSTGQTSGTNTFGNARILTSSGTNTWNFFSSDDTASTSTFTFDSTVQLGQNLIVIGQRNSAAGNVGVINFERAITFATTTVDGVSVPAVRTLTINSSNTNNTVNLKGANTYLGVTNVNGGIVNVQNNQSAATGGWNIQTPNEAGKLATVNFAAGSQFAVIDTAKIQIGSTSNSGSHPASTLNVAVAVDNDGALQMERASNLNLNNGAVWDQAGNLTLTARGGGSSTLTVNAGAEMTYTGSNTVILNSGTAGSGRLNINGTGRFTTAAGFENTDNQIGTGVSQITLTNGGTLRLSEDVMNLTTQTQFTLGTGGGVIDNNGFNATLSGLVTEGTSNTTTGITGTGSLTSTGSGTLTLSGLNTYSGDTTVSAGTLVISETGSLVFAPTSNGVSNKVTGAGLLVVDGAFNLNLSGANVANGNTWTLVDSTLPDYDPDTFNVTSNLGDFTESPSGVHSLTDGGNTWTFTESTGQLTLGVSALSGFASWIDGFGLALADQDPSDDPDNDGIDNLVEFVLNGNPNLSDNSILPALNVTATDFEFTYQRRDDSVSPETIQSFQWGTNLLDWPGNILVPATSGTVGVATITVSAGVPDDATTDTVKISVPKSEAGSSGKLFGRLQVVKP